MNKISKKFACPNCRAEKFKESFDIIYCTTCKKSYNIIEKIPIFLNKVTIKKKIKKQFLEKF